MHDCWAPYWKLNDGLHALCNAHLLRELVYAQEVTGQDWPTDMTELLLNAKQLSAAARQQGKPFDADAIAAFATVYHGIVRQGEQLNPPQTKPGAKPGRCKQSDAHNLLRRFRLHADAILRFIADPTVPFTNNIAERAVRMPKVKQKVRHEVAYRSCSYFNRKEPFVSPNESRALNKERVRQRNETPQGVGCESREPPVSD